MTGSSGSHGYSFSSLKWHRSRLLLSFLFFLYGYGVVLARITLKQNTNPHLTFSRSKLSASLSLSSLPLSLVDVSHHILSPNRPCLTLSITLYLSLTLITSLPLSLVIVGHHRPQPQIFKHLHQQRVPVSFCIYTYRLLLVKISSNALFGLVENWWEFFKKIYFIFLFVFLSMLCAYYVNLVS